MLFISCMAGIIAFWPATGPLSTLPTKTATADRIEITRLDRIRKIIKDWRQI